MTKLILGLIGATLITIAILGGYKYPLAIESQPVILGTTSGTAGTQKIAEFSFNPTVGTATSSSALNSDAQDRIITGTNVYCSGVGTSQTAYTGTGLANLTVKIATTSASAPAAITNTNFLLSDVIATSTAETYNASTTVLTPGTAAIRRWASGTYLTVFTNATNTAACIVNASYFQGLGV